MLTGREQWHFRAGTKSHVSMDKLTCEARQIYMYAEIVVLVARYAGTCDQEATVVAVSAEKRYLSLDKMALVIRHSGT